MINNIQALRAFAVLTVVLFHIMGWANAYGYHSATFSFIDNFGECGVDIFFVISGFVMVYIQKKNQKKPVAFIADRAKRIIPLYWSITMLFTLLLYFIPNLFRTDTFELEHSATSLLFISQAAGWKFPVVVQGWTLEYEMFFYLIFGLSIYLSKSKTVLATSLTLIAFTFLTNIKPIVLEFVFGMAICQLYLHGKLRNYGSALFLAGATGLLTSIFYKPDLSRLIIWGIPSALLVLGSCYLTQISNRLLVFLGAASYSIYLIHVMAMPFFYKIIRKIGISEIYSDLLVILCLLFSTLIGVILYYYYEKPLSSYLKKI